MEEYIDVLDDKGNLTGKQKLKSAVHRDGDRHKTVHVWIINPEGKLLIQRRAPIKENHPNMWDVSCAGHISTGEKSLDAALREAQEELDLVLAGKDFEYLFTVDNPRIVLNDGKYIDYEFNDVYLVRIKNVIPLRLQKEEVAETKWIPYQELEKVIRNGDPSFVPHQEEYKLLFSALRRR